MDALIAVIEDEEDLLELVEFNLRQEGYDVVGFLSTKGVEQLLKEEDVDLMIVDRNLPGAEGAEFVAALRNKGYNVPVFFLTAKDTDTEVVEGFEKGGDDYITKPFNMQELLLRVKAFLSRNKKEAAKTLQFRDIVMTPASKRVTVEGREVVLSKLEFNLLAELIRNKNIVLSRDHLLETVWGEGAFYQDKTVNVAIKRLKEKIDPDKNKEYIKTVRGTGYTLC